MNCWDPPPRNWPTPRWPTQQSHDRRVAPSVEDGDGTAAAARGGRQVHVGTVERGTGRMVRGLPHGVVEAFTQSVQPVLMNHCARRGLSWTAIGNRPATVPRSDGQAAGRRITQRNLYAVLTFVDRDNPAGSRLLTAPNGPHGTAEQAIFNERQTRSTNAWSNGRARSPNNPAGTRLPRSPLRRPLSRRARAPPRVLSQEARKARPLSAGGKACLPDAATARKANQTSRHGRRFLRPVGRSVRSRGLQSSLRAREEASGHSGMNGHLPRLPPHGRCQ